MTTNWKELLEKRRDNFGQEKAEAYTEKEIANIVAAYLEFYSVMRHPVYQYEAHKALAEIKAELEKPNG